MTQDTIRGLNEDQNAWLAHFTMFGSDQLYKLGRKWVTNIPSDPRVFKTKREASDACSAYASSLGRRRAEWYRQQSN